MSLIPYAGSQEDQQPRRPSGKFAHNPRDFKDLALLSIQTEFRALTRRYKSALSENRELKHRIDNLLDRISTIENIHRQASTILGGPVNDTHTSMFAADADRIVEVVADHYRMPTSMIFGRTRATEATMPRHISMFLIANILGITASAIGRYFTGRDHTTVIHALQKIARMVKTDEDFAVKIETLNSLAQKCTRGEQASPLS